MKTWSLAALLLSLTAGCDGNTLQEKAFGRYTDFYTTKGITLKNSGAGPEAWSSTNQYVPLLVEYADGETTVANALVRLRWAKVEDESGYHFERELDNFFLSAYRNKQKVCLGIFPLDSWTSNDVAVSATCNGRQCVAYIGYPEYIHQQLMQHDEYRPRLYQNYDGTITDADAPSTMPPTCATPCCVPAIIGCCRPSADTSTRRWRSTAGNCAGACWSGRFRCAIGATSAKVSTIIWAQTATR